MKKLLFFTVIVVFNISIMAQSDQERGHPAHSGLFISMSGGLTYISINDDITNGPYSNMQFKGIGGGFDIKLGAVVKDNFILHGDIITVSSGSINITADGNEIGTISGDNSIGMIMFGGGATYYFMPQNVFISGTMGVGGFSVTTDGESLNTQKGFGLYMKLGKEWWISKGWDIGGSIGFNYTNVNNEAGGITEKLSGISIGILFTATFN